MADGDNEKMKISLQHALLFLVAGVLLVGMIPAGLLLDRRLVAALEQSVRDDLSLAPLVLADRFQGLAGMRMMHARDVSVDAGVANALQRGDSVSAVSSASALVAAFPGESALVVGPDGRSWIGPSIPAPLIDATRQGSMPVEVVQSGDLLAIVALAPVMVGDAWRGAAGVWVPLAEDEAARLSVLTRSDVLIGAPDRGMGAYTGRSEPAMGLFGLLGEQPVSDEVRELTLADERYLVVSSVLPGGARITFVRALSEELAIVPTLRAVGVGVFALALVFALLVGGWFASRIARPVTSLAAAAARIRDGHFDSSAEHTMLAEVDQMAQAFEVMRDALAARIEELAEANAELEDRQERLSMLQAELVQWDRLSAASRLLAQLAHEVRNPVASVRNCLEILRRRVEGDAEASELADLAIDELLCMHELAEQMLDLHRPAPATGDCNASAVAENVAAVARMGLGEQAVQISVDAPDPVLSKIPGDALKQVLLNLVQNAQEAISGPGEIEIRVVAEDRNAIIEVTDTGVGISAEALPQVFDPFFTTKADVRGVGLGLFTAAGLARSHGGRIAASGRSDGRGAKLTVEIPLVEPVAAGVGA
jgi:signal transduction histidine kinase